MFNFPSKFTPSDLLSGDVNNKESILNAKNSRKNQSNPKTEPESLMTLSLQKKCPPSFGAVSFEQNFDV